MPPNTALKETVLEDTIVAEQPETDIKIKSPVPEFIQDKSYRTLWGTFLMPLKWPNIIFLTLLHLWALHTFITFPYFRKFNTFLWGYFLTAAGGWGVTAGAHRFWTHRAYKANLPLRIILMCCYALAGQNKLISWVQDHRIHHKFSETDADPHNANRGFFFAHIGWLMMKKHPEVLRKGKQIDLSDLYEDPVVRFQEKYFWILKAIFCFGIPAFVPWYFWGESLYWAFTATGVARYVGELNVIWSVNSAAHIFGYRPYDRNIQPVENLTVSICSLGEGWHNYHHAFPWDYKASELSNYSINITTMLIDGFAKIGWAYDLKTSSPELVRKTIEKCGDGSHESYQISQQQLVDKKIC